VALDSLQGSVVNRGPCLAWSPWSQPATDEQPPFHAFQSSPGIPGPGMRPYWKLNTSGKITTTIHAHTAYTGRYAVCHRSRGVKPFFLRRNLA